MTSEGKTKPDILVFFTDQQRWDTCDCYRDRPAAWDNSGRPIAITPNLDRMAAEGVRFDLALTCQPVCGPARACLQTGRYATEMGCFRNDIALPFAEQTIARDLAQVMRRHTLANGILPPPAKKTISEPGLCHRNAEAATGISGWPQMFSSSLLTAMTATCLTQTCSAAISQRAAIVLM